MSVSVRHDAFARGAFERECVGPGECHWCGDTRKRLFTYVWISDGSLSREPSIFNRHQSNHSFCNFQCFASFNS
jgi:hypothetical protein